MAGSSEETIISTKAVRSMYCKAFATRGKLLDFAKAAWLQYLNKKMYYFGVQLLDAQDAFLKRRSSPAASVLGEGQACSAAGAGADDPEDDDVD